MPDTDVLHPLEGPKKDSLTAQSEELTGCLNNIHQMEEDMSFNDLLTQLEMDYETYKKIIQSTFVRPKVFLKRPINECRVNNYNTVLLKCWKVKMLESKYVLDPYSWVSYIVSYIAKGQRGLSNLLQKACEEAKEIVILDSKCGELAICFCQVLMLVLKKLYTYFSNCHFKDVQEM